MQSKADPSPSSLFDRLVAREEKRGLILVAFLRICMLAFILLLFSKPDSPTGELYSLLEVLGWFIPGVLVQLFVARPAEPICRSSGMAIQLRRSGSGRCVFHDHDGTGHHDLFTAPYHLVRVLAVRRMEHQYCLADDPARCHRFAAFRR